MKNHKIISKGFTLIEILIVMLIISIASATAILTISHNKTTQLKNFANQLTNTLLLAQETAMLQPAVLGFSFDNKMTRFYEFKNNWEPTSNNMIQPHVIPDGIQIKLLSEEKNGVSSQEVKPKIIISTSGDITPFVIVISKSGSPPSYEIIGEENGKIYSGPISRIHTD